MEKIKQKTKNLLDLQHFLKNYNLKKKRYKLKNHLFENEVILKKNNNSVLIELNLYKNSFLPNQNQDNKIIIYNIQTQYENDLLLNYSLNYNLIYYLTQLMLKRSNKKKIMRVRIIGGTKKNILISFFGKTFDIKPKNLHKNRRLFYGQKLKSKKIIRYYKLKSLNFIKEIDLDEKSILSRKLYVKEINEKNNK